MTERPPNAADGDYKGYPRDRENEPFFVPPEDPPINKHLARRILHEMSIGCKDRLVILATKDNVLDNKTLTMAKTLVVYEAKLITARHFFERILPDAPALAKKIEAGADTLMAMPAESF